MKTTEVNAKKSTKNPTTNFIGTTHKDFCKKCLEYNGRCPDSKTGKPTSKCSL